MRYFDTSFLTPLVREEETSFRIARFMAGLPTDELAISRWTEVEFASLLARDVRTGIIESNKAHAAASLFQDVILESFIILLPSANDYELAKQYLYNFETGLRAGDAPHLGIAASHGVEAIYSLDRTMIKAGKILGLPVSAGIRAI